MSTTKTMTLDEAKKLPPMTEDEIRELENTPVRYDKDSPELSEEELSQFVPHYMAKPEFYRPKKADIHIRIDADVLDAFKSMGKGYQSKINAVLRKYIFG